MKHKEIIDKMKLEEKAALLSGKGEWQTWDFARLGIPSMYCSDGPHGIRKQAGAGDHLGLNPSLPATCFPTAATVANSWDPELRGDRKSARRRGKCTGRACSARPRTQYKEKSALRKKLRVFFRRSVSCGQDGSGICTRNPEPGRLCLPEALCRKQSGTSQNGNERSGG